MTTYKISATSVKDLQVKVTEAIKSHFKLNGIKMPFTNMTYSNKEIDGWFRVKEDGKVKKLNRKTKKLEEEKK